MRGHGQGWPSRFRTALVGERGSAQPLVAIVLGGVVLALVLLLAGTAHRVRVARVQWAADAAARAAAAEVVAGSTGGGEAAHRSADRLARANGARLVELSLVEIPGLDPISSGDADGAVPASPSVVVTVVADGVEARSAAGRFAIIPP